MTFHWSTVGHDAIKRYVEKLIGTGVFRSHAFFLSGPAHIGKTTLANDAVSMLLCEGTEQKPCGNCPHCTNLQKESHPDVYRVRRGEDEKNITVEHIREVIEQLQATSLFRSKRICVIEEADALSYGAANALLKTLEEPGKDTLFFFIASQEGALPATIRSRCQVIRMYPLKKQEVYAYAVDKGVEHETARELSQFAQGSLGSIVEWIENGEAWSKKKAQLATQRAVVFSPGYEKVKWYAKKDSVPFDLALSFAQDCFLHALGLPESRQFPWIAIEQKSDAGSMFRLLEACTEAMRLEGKNVNGKMIIDLIHAQVRNVI